MKKYLILLLSVFFLVGCAGEKEEVKNLSGLMEHFETQKITVGEKGTKAFEMVGATNGFSVDLNGSNVEFYEYDLENLSEEAKKNLEDAEELGMMRFMGFSVPVIKNGNLIMMNHDEHAEKDNIIEIFGKY